MDETNFFSKWGKTERDYVGEFMEKLAEQEQTVQEIMNGNKALWKDIKEGRIRKWFKYESFQIMAKLGHTPLVINNMKWFPILKWHDGSHIDEFVKLLEFFSDARALIASSDELKNQIKAAGVAASERTSKERPGARKRQDTD